MDLSPKSSHPALWQKMVSWQWKGVVLAVLFQMRSMLGIGTICMQILCFAEGHGPHTILSRCSSRCHIWIDQTQSNCVRYVSLNSLSAHAAFSKAQDAFLAPKKMFSLIHLVASSAKPNQTSTSAPLPFVLTQSPHISSK